MDQSGTCFQFSNQPSGHDTRVVGLTGVDSTSWLPGKKKTVMFKDSAI